MGVVVLWSVVYLPAAAAAIQGHPGLLLRLAHRATAPNPADWSSLTPIATLTRSRGGRVADTYSLYQGVGRAGTEPAVLLPCR